MPTDPHDPADASGLERTRDVVARVRRTHSPAGWERLSAKIDRWVHSRFRRAQLPPGMTRDDFVSEVMLVVLRDIDGFEDRGEGSFWAWMHRLANNRLQDLWRHHTAARRGGDQRQLSGDALDGIASRDPMTATATLRLRELEQVELDCVGRLSDDMRRVYLLRRREELPFARIGAIIGRSNEITVRSLFKRARDFVRRCLEHKMDDLGQLLAGCGEPPLPDGC